MLNIDDDAHPHTKTDGKDWRESYYCNFFDHESDLCGIFWQGKRPNSGFGEAVFLLLDGNKDLIRSVDLKEPVRVDVPEDRRKAGNQQFTCIEPWSHWKMRYEKGDDWFELDWQQLTDVCDWDWEDISSSKHFELAGKVRGRGVVGGRHIDFTGYGERDRSWGDRNYGPMKVSFWHTIQFPDDVAIHACALLAPDGNFRLHGFLHKDGITRGLTRFDANTVYSQPLGLPTAGKLHYEDEGGRVVDVVSYELLNYLAIGSSEHDGAQLGSDLTNARNLMFLTFERFVRSDGVIGRGMIDYNCWVGEQRELISAKGPVFSSLYKYGRM